MSKPAIDPKLWAAYQKSREAGEPLWWWYKAYRERKHYAYEYQRDRHGLKAVWMLGPFRYVARCVDDPFDYDLSYLGEFTDEGKFPETLQRARTSRSEYKRFRPQYSVMQRQKDLVLLGYAKGPAYALAVEQAYEDMKRAEDYGLTWHSCQLIVEVFRDDELIADTSVSGIAFDGGMDYIYSLTQEMAEEIRPDGHEACGRVGQLHLPSLGL
jgi:hypothetical protein